MSAARRAGRKREFRRKIIVGALVLDQIEKGTLPEEIHEMLKEDLCRFVPERDRDLFEDFDLERTPNGQ